MEAPGFKLFSLCTLNSVVARLFSSLFADIVKEFSQADFLGSVYLKSCGCVLVGRRSKGGIGVYFKRAELKGLIRNFEKILMKITRIL